MQITNILESFVSKYKNLFDLRRNTDEDTSRQEFEISINGPNFDHCNTVVEEAMDASWTKLWGAEQDANCQEQPPIHELACLLNFIDYWQ